MISDEDKTGISVCIFAISALIFLLVTALTAGATNQLALEVGKVAMLFTSGVSLAGLLMAVKHLK